QSVDLAVKTDRVLTMRMPFSRERTLDPNRFAFTREVLRRIAAVPGVAAVSVNTGLPPVYYGGSPIEVIGGPPKDDRPVILNQTTEQYAGVFSLRMVRGRYLSAQDVAAGQHSVVD